MFTVEDTVEHHLDGTGKCSVLLVSHCHLAPTAGNDNIDLVNLAGYGYSYLPCLVNLPNVVCVGGTDALNKRVRAGPAVMGGMLSGC